MSTYITAESDEQATCDNCGGTFVPGSGNAGDYCSRDCQREDVPGYTPDQHCPTSSCGAFVKRSPLDGTDTHRVRCLSCGFTGLGPCPNCDAGGLVPVDGGQGGLQAFRCVDCGRTTVKHPRNMTDEELRVAGMRPKN